MKFLLILLFPLMCSAADVAAVSTVRISRDEVKNIFRFRDFTFANGEKVRMVVLPKDAVATRQFLTGIGVSPERFFEFAETAFSTGRINLLYVAEDERELLPIVAKTPGAIGYAQKVFALHYRGRVYIVE